MNDTQEKIDLTLELLEKFNRKERYHLLCDAVVGSPFSLQDPFLEKINNELDWSIPRKGHVYVAMDYHLDWIASALNLVEREDRSAARAIRDDDRYIEVALPDSEPSNRLHDESNEEIITGYQTDADLLIAYQSNKQLVLVLVEAKLESGWDGSQLAKKGRRLERIFDEAMAAGWVVPRLILAGPNAHANPPNFGDATLKECPDWFFEKPSGEMARTNDQLRRIDLMAKHSLYRPARENEKGYKWGITKTWPKKEVV